MRENLIGSDSSCQDKLNNGKKFDVVIMNPPFSIGDKFLYRVLSIGNSVVTVQPCSWIFGKQKKKKICDLLKNCRFNLEMISNCFDAGITGQVAIIDVDFRKEKQYRIQNNDFVLEYRDIYDISPILDPILQEFNNIVKVLYQKDNFYNHMTWAVRSSRRIDDEYKQQLIKEERPIIRISLVRCGGLGREDFFTLVSRIEKAIQNKVLQNTRNLGKDDIKIKMFIICEDETEQRNILNYIMTDFARTCLMLIKRNANLSGGELKYIPWFDFKDPHFSKSPHEIDDWLFNKYGISDEIRKHIEEVLPDYYGIRG